MSRSAPLIIAAVSDARKTAGEAISLLAWLDNESNVSREDVVELVMVFFDAVADRVGD